MAKKVLKSFKVMAAGGKATPAPPLGPVLGANGVNPGQFVTKFNEATKALNGRVVGCVITVFTDKTFEFEIKNSPTSVLLAAAAKAEKGSGKPNTEKVGKISKAQLKQIAEEKFKDFNTADLEAAMRTIAGTARSMGITVEA
ncbi:MAG: 50S ribosomal protein L11 [Planctomycetota bacterium]|jgi:large subunit ribosomal protein L11|nr:MAG: 50S ribosomal protein L11 [Planctomycetota bacterium]RLS92843.1 MAG: 50S ribosomal protein L11 [Planctomycetota bacterium]